jgi:hypothetical protein
MSCSCYLHIPHVARYTSARRFVRAIAHLHSSIVVSEPTRLIACFGNEPTSCIMILSWQVRYGRAAGTAIMP